jgi:hypothetical protein
MKASKENKLRIKIINKNIVIQSNLSKTFKKIKIKE